MRDLYAIQNTGNSSKKRRYVFTILCNGILAVGLNLVSFTANKEVGALTMTISATVKQALTIGIAVVLWKLRVGRLNQLGMFRTSSSIRALVR